MFNTEAQARIKIDNLLKKSGWRFLDKGTLKANVHLEANIKLKTNIKLEGIKSGALDYLLLNDKGFPLAVLEAKKPSKEPLDAKEQARKYAKSLKVQFIILSNGNAHYFWDLQNGHNPEIITKFPTQLSLQQKLKITTKNKRCLSDEIVKNDYIALCQKSDFKSDPLFKDESTKNEYIHSNHLRFLRSYQLDAIHALQKSAKKGNKRFLFEMATGTGKTLVSAAIIRLFLATGNANRILFLVDRLELEEQAYENFNNYLKNDYDCVIYKNNKNNWRINDIIISTVQSLAINDKYKTEFDPTDFDLIIADESHRAINGNARAVFEYFIGYKLGLTATPKNYLKNMSDNLSNQDPKKWEARQLLDTYKTFGCDSGEPTYCYSLVDGVKQNYLISPTVLDARTEITTDLLSKKGYGVLTKNKDGSEEQKEYFSYHFEKKFFSEKTNNIFCKTFLENAQRDPISQEIGKTIIFCVSQSHASKITQILNKQANTLWPNKYNSDFAIQVSSDIPNAGLYSSKFANDTLNGHSKFLENYKVSKTRVCVTVGMMTTGYDCPSILNIVLLRPIFSPTDFVQIKGRGTRTHPFEYEDENKKKHKHKKQSFKLFDFFAVCEYFEKEFNYNETLKLPKLTQINNKKEEESINIDALEIFDMDKIKTLEEQKISPDGMKIDREFFAKTCNTISQDKELKTLVKNEDWDTAINTVRTKYENKPTLFLNLDKIKHTLDLDRGVTWEEVLQKAFGLIDKFETRDEKLEHEADKFIAIHNPDKNVQLIKKFIKAYVGHESYRKLLDDSKSDVINQNFFPYEDYKTIALSKWNKIIPEYAKKYISFNIYNK